MSNDRTTNTLADFDTVYGVNDPPPPYSLSEPRGLEDNAQPNVEDQPSPESLSCFPEIISPAVRSEMASASTALPQVPQRRATPSNHISRTSRSRIAKPRGAITCNFLSLVERNSDIRGSWVVDPQLSLGRLGHTSTFNQDNLTLGSHNGNVNADIYVSQPSKNQQKRVEISTFSHNGNCTTRLHGTAAANADSEAPNRHRLILKSWSMNGDVKVYLPRSFHGTLSLKIQNGDVSASPDIRESIVQIHGQYGAQTWCLGPPESSLSTEGDEVKLQSINGNLYVDFIEA